MGFFKKKKKPVPPAEAIKALGQVEKGLSENLQRAEEAKKIAKRLSESRQANHYAERIRSAYHLESR